MTDFQAKQTSLMAVRRRWENHVVRLAETDEKRRVVLCAPMNRPVQVVTMTPGLVQGTIFCVPDIKAAIRLFDFVVAHCGHRLA